jgi:CRP/FNR family transcriptional regulator, cyclic AMP receptor protein
MPELARIETVVFLQSVDFFSACTAEEALRIASIANERSFPAGETLFRPRDPAAMLYCVVRGEVEVEDANGARSRVGPLQTVGLAEILSGRLRTGTATATRDVLALVIEADDFFDLLSNNIDIVKSLFRHLIDQVNFEKTRELTP